MKNNVNPFIKYPLYPAPTPFFEKVSIKAGRSYIRCLVCGNYTWVHTIGDNLRETCICNNCYSTNRQRQIAYVLLHAAKPLSDDKINSLRDFVKLKDLVVYNTECHGSLHNTLSCMDHYVYSCYFGEEYRSGDIVNGMMHQDLMDLSFANDCMDIVISSDVFEHVADPYKAHREVYRVLKRGGKHIFTVPFHASRFIDDQRAVIGGDGEVVYLKEPIFHGDPVSTRPEGVLVFTIFSIEMLAKLERIGFKTNFFHLRLPKHGIFGPDALVFEAVKE